jgi:hypothetical protein
MNLIDDEKSDEVYVAGIRLFPGDNIPFLRSHNNNGRLHYLLLRHLSISGEFADLRFVVLEAVGKIANHLLNGGLHRHYIHNFE